MSTADAQLLVGLLKRKGAYAREVVNALGGGTTALVSDQYLERGCLTTDAVEVKTYSGLASFVIRSVFVLPFVLSRFALFDLRRFDVFYVPMASPWNLAFAVLFKSSGRRFVHTIHDARSHTGSRFAIWTSLGDWLGARIADEVIFLTEGQRTAFVRSRPWCTAKSHVVPHGLITLEGLQTGLGPPLRDGHLNLLFFGHVTPYKGVEMLCEAFIKVDEDLGTLHIAGAAQYRIDIPEHPRITFENRYLSDAELAERINATHVIVLPYREATQSGVLSIAIESERPLVVTDVGSLNEQIGADECVLVRPNPKDLAEGLHRLAADPDLRRRCSSRLRARKTDTSWRMIGQRIRAICNRSTQPERNDV